MKKKLLMLGGALALAVPAAAGMAGMEPALPPPTPSPTAALKADCRYDRMVLKNPDFLGERLRYIQLREKQAKVDLARKEKMLSRIEPRRHKTVLTEVRAFREKERIKRLKEGIREDDAQIGRAEKDRAVRQAALSRLETQEAGKKTGVTTRS